MATVNLLFSAFALLTFASFIHEGDAQAMCFTVNRFFCSGNAAVVATTGQECCDQGYLSFRPFGSDTCEPCTENVICHNDATCTSPDFTENQPQLTSTLCCAGGGGSYVNNQAECTACPTAISGCFSDLECTGTTETISTDLSLEEQVRECCINTPAASFSIGGQCANCIVYGFDQRSSTAEERGLSHSFTVRYLKAPAGVTQTLRGNVFVTPGVGTAASSDYQLTTTTYTIRPGSPVAVRIIFNVDNIAQEIDETLQLQLSPSSLRPPRGAILAGTIDLVIVDSDMVNFQFTENDYREGEAVRRIRPTINKSTRIANPLVFSVTPYTIDDASAAGITLPGNVPNDTNPFSPNRARIEPLDRRDFDPTVLEVVFQPDELEAVNDVSFDVEIFDDLINEASEEVFIIDLTLVDSTNPASVTISRPTTLMRIADNDPIQIGFLNDTYNFLEPEGELFISDTIFLAKEMGVVSEQTFFIRIEANAATPSGDIALATVQDNVTNNDYSLGQPFQTTLLLQFPSEEQQMDITLSLFGDLAYEGTEAFQLSSTAASDVEDGQPPDFETPVAGSGLFPSAFVIIQDSTTAIIGYENNVTIAEGDSGEVCLRVFNPPDDEGFNIVNLILVGSNIDGTATSSTLDYLPLNTGTGLVFLDDATRQQCFTVSPFPDSVYETTENFFFSVDFDSTVNEATRNTIDLAPQMAEVFITDQTELTIGFFETEYNVNEADGVATVMFGIIGTTTIAPDTEVIVELSTIDSGAVSGSDFSAVTELFSFNSEVRSYSFNFSLVDDGVFELDEEFIALLTLVSDSPRVTINPEEAEVNIRDEDVIEIGYSESSYSFDEDSGSNTVTISFQGAAGQFAVGFDYSIQESGSGVGFATGNADFTAVSGASLELQNADGSHSVVILEDQLAEGQEEFNLFLSNVRLLTGLGGDDIVLSEADRARIVLDTEVVPVSINDNDAVVIGFLETVYEVNEGDGSVTFEFGVLEGNLAVDVDISFMTNQLSALDGPDYTGVQQVSTITGQGSIAVEVNITDDNINEPIEFFTASIAAAVAGGLPSFVTLSPDVATAQIVDNDMAIIGFINSPYTARESDGSVTFMVALIGDTQLSGDVSVLFSTNQIAGPPGRVAMSGGDFTEVVERVLTFGPETTSFDVEVDLTQDDVFELTESFEGLLTLPAGATGVALGTSQAAATVLDDDLLVVGFSENTYSFPEDVTGDMIGFSLTGELASQLELSLNYNTVTLGSGVGFATPGDDFTEADRTVSISGAQTDVPFGLILTDDIAEGTEVFGLELGEFSFIFNGATIVEEEDERSRVSFDPANTQIEILDSSVARIGFLAEEYPISEDGGSVEFMIGVIEGNIGVDVELSFSTADDSAVAGSDYDATTETVILSSAQPTATVSVPITNDDVYESVEQFFGTLSGENIPSFISLDPATATAIITDQDSVTVGFAPTDYTAREGMVGGEINLIVTVIEGSIGEGASFDIDITTTDGSATIGDDYTFTPQTLTFTSDNNRFEVPAGIIEDSLFEFTGEDFFGNLAFPAESAVDRVTIDPDRARVFIEDDDRIVVGFVPAVYSVTEGEDTSVELTVMIMPGFQSIGQPVILDYTTTDGSATSGSDYVTSTGSIQFTPGVFTATITVPLLDDNVLEGAESFTVTLTDPTNRDPFFLTIDPDVATVNIADNDGVNIGFDRLEYDVVENERFSNVTIFLSGSDISENIDVRVTTADGSAISVGPEADFESHDMVYTFVPGGPRRIVVPIRILDDLLLEDDEGLTSLISLSSDGVGVSLSPAEAMIRIIDDDSVVIGFSETLYEVNEGDGEAVVEVRVLLGELRREVVVEFTTAQGTARDGSDYTGETRILTFDENTTSQTISISLINDDINEILESFTGVLATTDGDVNLTPNSTTIEITDNDLVTISIRDPMYVFIEGEGNQLICIDKVGNTDQVISATISGPTQTGPVTELLVFAANEFENCVTFPVQDDDIALEETESFTWTLTITGSPPGVILGENPTTDIMVVDDDILTINLRKGGAVPEDVGVVEACIEFNRPFAREFVVSRSSQLAANSTLPPGAVIADPDTDFDGFADQLTLTPDDFDRGQRCFNVTIMDDNIVEEAMECFGVSLTLPEAERENVMLVNGSETCCILDNDFVTIGFDPISYSINEVDGSVVLSVRIRSGELGRAAEVLLTTEDGFATSTAPVDYINPGIVTLQFDATQSVNTATITIENDDIFEIDENFFANLVTFDPAVIVDPARAEVTIIEDNTDRPTIGFVPDEYVVNEVDGTVTLNVELIDGTLERTVEVDVSFTPGTATEAAPADYSGAPLTLTFGPSFPSMFPVPVIIINDDRVEGDEQFTASLSLVEADSAFLNPDVATVTIQDDPADRVVIGIERDYIVDEGNPQEICAVLLSGVLERSTTVTISAQAQTATEGFDFEAFSAELVFDESVIRACAVLQTIQDDLVEDTETLQVVLTTADSAVTLDPGTASVSIVDNDEVVLGLSETTIVVDEASGQAEVCVVIVSGEIQRDVSFSLRTVDGTATAPGDYGALNADLVFTAEDTAVCVNISIVGDDIYEFDEMFNVVLETDDTQASVDPTAGTATVTITDNDSVTIGFEPTELSVSEEAGTVRLCARILMGTIEREVVVAYTTRDGQATAPDDYTQASGSLIFNPSNQNELLCYDVEIVEDEITEGTEVFFNDLSTDEPRVVIDPGTATVSILDANVVIIGYLNQPYSVLEEEGPAVVTVGIISGALSDDLVVNYITQGSPLPNAASDGFDYTFVGGSLVFNSVNRVLNFSIPIIPDTILEGDEVFNTNINIGTEGIMASIENNQPLAEVTIIDNDVVNVVITVPEVTESEDVGLVEVCAAVELPARVETEFSVTVTLEDGTARVGEDYGLLMTELIFDPDNLEECFNITILDDRRHELDETFTIVLTSDNPLVSTPDEPTVVTIADDDTAVIGWEQTIYTVDETVDVLEICAVIRSGELTFELPALSATSMDGTAIAGNDYVALSDELVFSDSILRDCTAVDIIANTVYEELIQQLTVILAQTITTPRVTVDPDVAAVEIVDDDTVQVGFAETMVSVSEGDGVANVEVIFIQGFTEAPIPLRVTTRNGTATFGNDFSTSSIDFDLNNNGFTVSFGIIDDFINELTESFWGDLNFQTPLDRVTISPETTQISIEDNDAVTIGFEREIYVVNEGAVEMVCVIITEDSPQLSRPLTVSVLSIDGSALSPGDYEAVSVDVTFNPGSREECISVTTLEDEVVDGGENFTLVLTTLESSDVIILNPDRAIVDIEEDDFVRVMFGQTSYTFSEDGIVGQVEVVKSGFTDEAFEVTVIGGPSDQTDIVRSADGLNQVVRFEPGPDAPNSIFVEFTLTDDLVGLEAIEMYVAELDLVEPSLSAVQLGMITMTTIQVTDNDVVEIGFEDETEIVAEDDVMLTSCIMLSNPALMDFDVPIVAIPGTATTDDYSLPFERFMVTVMARQTRVCFNVSIIDDLLLEIDEEFTLFIAGPTETPGVVITRDRSVVTIVDNDRVTIGIVDGPYTVTEGGVVEVCAELTSGTIAEGREVRVQLSTTDDSAEAPGDYSSVSQELVFDSDVSRLCVNITANEDEVVEDDETFTVTVTTTDPDVTLDPDTAVVTIEEDDVVRVMFGQPVYTFTEDGIVGQVEVVKIGFTDEDFEVIVRGGPSVQTDIVQSAEALNQVVRFLAGPASPSSIFAEFTITDDLVALEAIEMYVAELIIVGSPSQVALGTVSMTTVQVTDNDVVSVGFGLPELTISEGMGSFMMCVVASGPRIRDIVVNLSTTDITATADLDYVRSSVPASVTIPASEDRACFNVVIEDDLIFEPTERFDLVIDSVTDGVMVSQGTSEISIVDNEDVTVRFEQESYTVQENAGTAVLCLIKEQATSGQVTITVETSDGTAISPVDFTAGVFPVTFNTGANERQCISVAIINDNIDEGSENFFVAITETPGGVTAGTPSTATVTITDGTTILVNDTAIGDPLFSVPIHVINDEILESIGTERLSLCYEIHGEAGQYFNLVTDECTSVNTEYSALTDFLNIMTKIAVRAQDNVGRCRNIMVDLQGCSASVDGVPLAVNARFMDSGISVRRYTRRVRISVPNCNEQSVVMWVLCETRRLESGGENVDAQMLRIDIMRGLNSGHSDSHGIMGQFWAKPATVTEFSGVDRNGNSDDTRHVMNVNGRSFTGQVYPLNWAFENQHCLYSGNRQGGPIYEILSPNDPVIEGTYRDYQVESAFSEGEIFTFSRFNEAGCDAGSGGSVDCGPPPAIDNGSPGVPDVTTVGGVVTYTCDSGFVMNTEGRTSVESTCRDDGTWFTPLCTVFCPFLSDPANGFINFFNFAEPIPGALARYSCFDGFELSGGEERVCQDNGTWSGGEITCVVDCGPPPAIDNGSPGVPDVTTVGGVVTYTCDSGFVITPEGRTTAVSTCRDDGSWSNVLCTVFCPFLFDPANGFITLFNFAEPIPGALVRYSCSDGFELSGGEERVCQDNGTWSGGEITCVEVTCPLLTAPGNGSISFSPSDGIIGPGSVATYSCDPGFGLEGGSSRTCGPSGSWTGDTPSCTPLGNCRDCSESFSCERETITGDGNCINSCAGGDSCDNADFVCAANSSCTTQCSGFDSCDSSTIACPANESCNFICDGSESCDRTIITCPANNNCTVICDGPGSCSVATIICPTGDYSCNILCSRPDTCLATDVVNTHNAFVCCGGRCSDTEPQLASGCPTIDCGAPPAIENGIPGIPDRTSVDGVVTYTCNPGFESSSPTATCGANGLWLNVPTCTEPTDSTPAVIGTVVAIVSVLLIAIIVVIVVVLILRHKISGQKPVSTDIQMSPVDQPTYDVIPDYEEIPALKTTPPKLPEPRAQYNITVNKSYDTSPILQTTEPGSQYNITVNQSYATPPTLQATPPTLQTTEPGSQRDVPVDEARATPTTLQTTPTEPGSQRDVPVDEARATPPTLQTTPTEPGSQRDVSVDEARATPPTLQTTPTEPGSQRDVPVDEAHTTPPTLQTTEPGSQRDVPVDEARATPPTLQTTEPGSQRDVTVDEAHTTTAL